MKYIISYCIAVLLTILLAGCTETTKIGPESPEGPAYVEVSSDKLIFDADGGSVSIVVATNAAAWDYTSTATGSPSPARRTIPWPSRRRSMPAPKR